MIEYLKGFEGKVLKLIPETHELEDLILQGKWDLKIPERDFDDTIRKPLYEQSAIYRLKVYIKEFRPDLYEKYRLLIE